MACDECFAFILLFLTQIFGSEGLSVCTYHYYSFGKRRVRTVYCDDWEYCCSNVCCQGVVEVYRLWYFWAGIFLLTVVLITVSFTWYKKKYQGRVIRIGPLSMHQMSVETVTTQYTIQPHLYHGQAGIYNSVPPPPPGPPPPTGPPPPYHEVSTNAELPQYTRFAPMKPGYTYNSTTQ